MVLILMMISILEEHFNACVEADTAVAGSVTGTEEKLL